MSNLEQAPQETELDGEVGPPSAVAGPVRELLFGHEVALGGARAMTVTRTLPNRGRRMVGAWCFADAYGPTDLAEDPGMRVPPHPHTALQTVSWLLAGEVLHRDSLGNQQLIRPGQLNLMTAGRGISHSEETPPEHSRWLHGVQLWVALPDDERRTEPQFEHHGELPVVSDGGVDVTVVMGELAGATSPARTYTPLVCADATFAANSATCVPLRPEFEYAVLVLSGVVQVDGGSARPGADGDAPVELAPGPLLYLGAGRSELAMAALGPARLLLLGGEPFEEQLVMWWNFVGRSHDDIVQAREDWQAGVGFGAVQGFDGDRLPAPTMPGTKLRPRGRER
ncbi:MAG TPA: pirin family protein [Kineosporiaceae bacterium]|nr:pirin family protein [Kineosporiaceae bacterium]